MKKTFWSRVCNMIYKVDTGQVVLLSSWIVPWQVSVEFDIILVPFDRVEIVRL
ncbi:unnamed protein product [Larinioides sclopetarius]|uniref:Uncharacterized protein n=1 Tax=Larinioides sclopetarius TaxID=280406 RepID=A0AAV1ZMT5_9ARAC